MLTLLYLVLAAKLGDVDASPVDIPKGSNSTLGSWEGHALVVVLVIYTFLTRTYLGVIHAVVGLVVFHAPLDT